MTSIYGADSCQEEIKKEKLLLWPKKKVEIKSGNHFNFPKEDYKALFRFEYLSLVVDLKTSKPNANHQLFISLQDNNSHNYWEQLNHISTLKPGKQRIFIPLHQYVGERGSQRKARKIDLKNIRKLFASFNPDAKDLSGNVILSQLELVNLGRPAFPRNVSVFNFGVDKREELDCVQFVDEKSKLLSNIDLWRKEDSVYLDPFLKSVIFINRGNLDIPIDNGTYEVTLYWNSLGYWHPTFYKGRKVFINDKPWLIEDRSSLSDYERDLFIFQDKIPDLDDHPWDWLYKDVMRPITTTVVVKNKILSLSFEGDASAVGLNGLILGKVDKKSEINEFKNFKESFKNYLRSLYDLKIRRAYQNDSIFTAKKSLLSVTKRISRVSPFDQIKEDLNEKDLYLSKNTGQYLNIILQTPFSGDFEISFIANEKGPSLPFSVAIYKGIDQWVSLDRNHESYTLETQYFKKNSLNVLKSRNQHFLLSFQAALKKSLPQLWQGVMQITVKGSKESKIWNIPLKINFYKNDIPKPEIPVGFLGLNSLRYHYYDNPSKFDKVSSLDQSYLALLEEGGFTSFSGIPTYSEDSTNLTPIIIDNVKKFLAKAKAKGMMPPFFTYGGPFLHEFFEGGSGESILKQKVFLNKELKTAPLDKLVFQFTDEASGYSATLDRDMKRQKFLRENFPLLKLGGFTQWGDDSPDKIIGFNKSLDQASFSHLGHGGVSWLESSSKDWGLYNQAQGGREDPYEIFGRKLFKWTRNGHFSHYLEWNTSAIQNLPYFDLDGREADVAIAYPDSKGRLHPTIKYFQASEGLTDYRWLRLLSSKKAFKSEEILKEKDPNKFRSTIFLKLKQN